MGEQQRLVEPRLAATHDRIDRDAGQILELRQQRRVERQRHQRRARRHDLEAELLGDLVAESARSHFRNRRAAGRDHQRAAAKLALIGHHDKAVFVFRDRGDAHAQPQLRMGLAAFLQQHVDDLPRRAVAEQLPARLLVPGDAVALDQRDEVALGVAAQRRTAELRIVRQKIRRAGVQIGEIAAPAAGDANLLGRVPRLLQHQHRASALAGDAGAHQARGARPENDDVVAIRVRMAS